MKTSMLASVLATLVLGASAFAGNAAPAAGSSSTPATPESKPAVEAQKFIKEKKVATMKGHKKDSKKDSTTKE